MTESIVSLDQASINALAAAITGRGAGGGGGNNRDFSGNGSVLGGVSAGFEKKLIDSGKAAFEGVGEFVTNSFTKAGGSVTDQASAVAKSIPIINIFGGAITNVVGYLEDTQSTFQALSKVGAGMNGNLAELRRGAAQTRMPLTEFANMVGNNTQLLAGFAGGVQGGAKRFRQLSDAMWTGSNGGLPVIDGFMNLGYSIKDANEFIIKNMEIQQRQAKFRNSESGDEEMLAASLRMASSLDVMAKLSGKQLDQMQQEILATQLQGRVNAALRQMGPESQAAFTEMQIGLANAGEGANAYAKDLLSYGFARSTEAQAFAVTNDAARAQIDEGMRQVKAGNADAAGQASQAAAGAVAAFAQSERGLTMARLGGLGSVFDSMETSLESQDRIINMVHAQQEKVLANTGQSLSFSEAYNQIVGELSRVTATTISGTGEGQEISQALVTAQKAVADSAAQLNLSLASNMDTNTEAIDSVREFTTAFIEMIQIGTGAVQGAMNFAVPGTSTAQKTALFPPKLAPPNVGGMSLEEILDLDGFNPPVIDTTPADPTSPSPKLGGGGVKAGQVYEVNEDDPDRTELFAPGMSGAVIPNMKSVMNRLGPTLTKVQQEIAKFGAPQSAQMAATGGNDLAALLQVGQLSNELLSQLVGVNTTQARNGEKLVRNARSTGNFLNGIGRA